MSSRALAVIAATAAVGAALAGCSGPDRAPVTTPPEVQRLGAAAPPPGQSVMVEALRVDGQESSVRVSTDESGVVTVTDEAGPDTGSTDEAGTAGLAGACADRAYALEGFRVTGLLRVWYNPANSPTAVRTATSTAVDGAVHAVATGYNRCNQTRTTWGRVSYAGLNTARQSQVDSLGRCSGNDGFNVAGWGTLPSAYLAITCVYFAQGRVINSDVMLNKRFTWFTTKPAGCRYAWDVQSVLTHEQGHTWGLAHVDPARYGGQTMATTIPACDTSRRAFALGDYTGLARLYGGG